MVGNRKFEKDQCTFCKEKRHWKSDCPKLNKSESRSKANVVKSDGNDSDSSYFSLSITPLGCHSDASEWVLESSSSYHICPRRELFASFEELDGGLMSMGDGNTCQLVGKGTVRIRMYDETLRELKEVRYIPTMTKNIISVGALEAEDLRRTLGEGILNMSSGSLIVLKGIRRNNVYYLMGSTVTRLASSG